MEPLSGYYLFYPKLGVLIPSLIPNLFSPNPSNKEHLEACYMTLPLPFILGLTGTQSKRQQVAGVLSMEEQQLYNYTERNGTERNGTEPNRTEPHLTQPN